MKLSTVRWFLKNPQFLGQAFQVAKRRLLDKPERYLEQKAIGWCEQNELPFEEVLRKIGIANPELDLQKSESQYFDYADVNVSESPVQMGGRGGLEMLYNLVIHFKPAHILETGVAYGWSSLSVLLAIKKNSVGQLASVDMPYVNMGNEPYVGIAVHPDLKSNWKLIRKADRQGIPEAVSHFGGQLDLVHYDSDKSYSGRMWAYPILWRALAKGGVFISDDIQDNVGFMEFCQSVSVPYYIYKSDEKYVGIILKES